MGRRRRIRLAGRDYCLSSLEKDFYCLSPFEFAIFSHYVVHFVPGDKIGGCCDSEGRLSLTTRG